MANYQRMEAKIISTEQAIPSYSNLKEAIYGIIYGIIFGISYGVIYGIILYGIILYGII